MTPSIFGIVLAELLTVAWVDIKTQKISNRWILLNVIGAMLFYVFYRDFYVFSWEVLLFPVGFIVIGFLLFLGNVMGAGDSKYLASLFLLIPGDLHFIFFEKILLSTIVIGLALLMYKLFRSFSQLQAYLISRYWVGIVEVIRSRFSYAPVILVAWILLGVEQWK